MPQWREGWALARAIVSWSFQSTGNLVACLVGWLVGCLVYVEADLIGGWTDGGLTDWWLDRLAAGPIGGWTDWRAAFSVGGLFVCLVG
jgi:hypothetical protein